MEFCFCQPGRAPSRIATDIPHGPNTASVLLRYSLRFSHTDWTLQHFVYVKETAELVPAWLPYRVGWAYLTGAGQIACGLGVLFSVLPRVAAWAEAGMLTLFTLLVWGPAILSAPRTRLPWTRVLDLMGDLLRAWVVAQKRSAKGPCQTAGLRPLSRI